MNNEVLIPRNFTCFMLLQLHKTIRYPICSKALYFLVKLKFYASARRIIFFCVINCFHFLLVVFF